LPLFCASFCYLAANPVALGIAFAGFEVLCVLSHLTSLQDQADLRKCKHAITGVFRDTATPPPPTQKNPKKKI